MTQERLYEVLSLTRASLIADFGNLDDVPRELANTIANVYFQYFLLGGGDPPDQSSTAAMINYIQKWDRVQREFPFTKEVVAEIRNLRKKAHPTVVNAAAHMFISILKYKIDDAVHKSIVRQKFDRLLHRDKVDEFPNLLEDLDLKSGPAQH